MGPSFSWMFAFAACVAAYYYGRCRQWRHEFSKMEEVLEVYKETNEKLDWAVGEYQSLCDQWSAENKALREDLRRARNRPLEIRA
jgi:hypothetical protein